MRGLYTVFYLLFFAASYVLRSSIRRKTLRAEKVPGRVVASWTTKYIFYVYLLILAGSLAEYFLARRPLSVAVGAAGLLLYAAGIAGRQWAFRSLGRYWSVDIEVRPGHPVVREGAYRYLRHPNTLFHSLEVIGLTLVPNAYFSLLFFFAAYLPVIIYRAVAEENALLAASGEYALYRAQVRAFLPLPR